SPSPYCSTALSCVLIQVRLALSGASLRVEGKLCFPGMMTILGVRADPLEQLVTTRAIRVPARPEVRHRRSAPQPRDAVQRLALTAFGNPVRTGCQSCARRA